MVKESSGGFGEVVKTVVYALLLAGLIRTILFQPFWIPSGSMKPTLLIGDFLFVNKFAYGYSWASCPSFGQFHVCGFAKDREGRLFGSAPERGDVVVFKHPVSEADFIKRVIGIPGDRVQMRNGVLYINDAEVPQVADGVFGEAMEPQGPAGSFPRCSNGAVAVGAVCEKEQFVETLPNGQSHHILNIGSGTGDNTRVFAVPEGQYLFMGDNRDNSMDSRYPRTAGGVGLVEQSAIIGRADRIIFSSAGRSILFFWTWRSDRFFKAVD